MRHSTVMAAASVIAAALASAIPAISFAQAFPNKPIKLLVGFAAGGISDIIARNTGNDMSTRLGQPVVVDNRAGASGLLAYDVLREAPPDGYTLFQFTTPTLVSTILAGKVPPNPATAFTSIGYQYEGGIIVSVNPASPYMANVRSVADLIAAARANPGKINFASAGTGSSGHLFGMMLASAAGVEWTHIGYKGTAPATTDFMAGRISFVMMSVPNEKQLLKEDKVRLPVISSGAREAKYPEVPSIAESGFPDLVTTTWGGVIGPAGMPKAIADRLTAELRTTIAKPEIRAGIVAIAPDTRVSNAEEFAARYIKDYEVFGRVVKAANIKMD